jgi:hypothetical protein
MKSKLCRGCNESKPLTDFANNKAEPDGLQRRCKPCCKVYYHKRMSESADHVRQQRMEWFDKNRDISLMKRREWEKQYFKDDKKRLIRNIRSRISIVVKKKGFIKSKKTRDVVGCSVEFLMTSLQNRFQEGMSWDNYGEWEIDHIIPISSAKTIEDIYQLNHYTNLQPLWKTENASKSNKIETRHRT